MNLASHSRGASGVVSAHTIMGQDSTESNILIASIKIQERISYYCTQQTGMKHF